MKDGVRSCRNDIIWPKEEKITKTRPIAKNEDDITSVEQWRNEDYCKVLEAHSYVGSCFLPLSLILVEVVAIFTNFTNFNC